MPRRQLNNLDKLSQLQVAILLYLAECDRRKLNRVWSPSALCRRVGTPYTNASGAAISRAVRRLEQRGLVARYNAADNTPRSSKSGRRHRTCWLELSFKIRTVDIRRLREIGHTAANLGCKTVNNPHPKAARRKKIEIPPPFQGQLKALSHHK